MRRKNLLARLLRAASGKSQEDISKKIGVNPSHLSRVERGKDPPAR